jgi:alkylhydroperoxidase/carboxymuconolactone decarboxylase family protein YurZ
MGLISLKFKHKSHWWQQFNGNKSFLDDFRGSETCLSTGPLDRKTALLIRIGIAAAAKKRTPLAIHIRTALDEGISNGPLGSDPLHLVPLAA